MCSSIYRRYKLVLDKISKRFKGLQKICRGIALLDAILGLIILIILLVRQIRSGSLNKDDSSNSRTGKIVTLVVQALEIIFALILYEGVRQRISCMIKTWLLYCLARFIVTIFGFLTNASDLRLWKVCFEGTFTLFHFGQGVFILAFKNEENSDNPSVNEADGSSNKDVIELQDVILEA